MIRRVIFTKWAVPSLAVGMALFFAACQTKPPPPPPVETVRPDMLAQAEMYAEKGEWDKALTAYRAYLQDAPRTEATAQALRRTSEIYRKRNQPKEALAALETLCRDYPDMPSIPEVRYEMAAILSRIGEHSRSATESLAWLDRYPHHPLKKHVYLVLGEDFSALGDPAEAFHWWLKARPLWAGDAEQTARLDQKLNELISASGPVLLQQFAEDAAGTPYAPSIYHRMTAIYMDQGESEAAEKSARSLMRASRDDQWISKGKAFLERLDEERAVKQGALGCLLPLSGPFSVYGEEVLRGIQLGMLEGGYIPARDQVELLIEDTGGDPEKTAAALDLLARRDKVMAVLGPLSSKAAGAAAAKAQEIGLPMIALSQREGITSEGEMVFRNFLTPAQEIKGLLDVAVGRMGLQRFAILYPDNAYGRYCMNTFWDILKDMGGTVAAVESYGVGDTDFADPIKKMVGLFHPRPPALKKKLEARRTQEDEESRIYPEKEMPIIDFDAIFIPDNFQRIAMIAPQLAFYDVLDVQLLGTSAWQSPKLIDMAREYVQGAVFCSGFTPHAERPEVRLFVDAYRANFGTDPGILAACGYDTIRLLEKGLSEAPAVRTRRDLAKALLETEGFEGVTGTIRFDSQGEAEKAPIILTVSGNKIVPLM